MRHFQKGSNPSILSVILCIYYINCFIVPNCWRKDPAWTLRMIQSSLVVYWLCLRPCIAISLMTICVIYWYLSPICYSSLGEASGSRALSIPFLPHYAIYHFYVYILSSCDLHPDITLYGIYIDTLLYGYRRDTFPPLNILGALKGP